MNKDLETLEKLLSFASVMSENMIGLTKGNYDGNQFIKKTYDYLHKYNVDAKSRLELEITLKRLEAIDNANPSEALEKLGELKYNIQDEIAYYYKGYTCCKEAVHTYDEDFKIIENALLKTQVEHKALEIIKEKRVDLCILTDCDNFNEYNKSLGNFRPVEDRLTYEEFNLLKEVLE